MDFDKVANKYKSIVKQKTLYGLSKKFNIFFDSECSFSDILYVYGCTIQHLLYTGKIDIDVSSKISFDKNNLGYIVPLLLTQKFMSGKDILVLMRVFRVRIVGGLCRHTVAALAGIIVLIVYGASMLMKICRETVRLHVSV